MGGAADRCQCSCGNGLLATGCGRISKFGRLCGAQSVQIGKQGRQIDKFYASSAAGSLNSDHLNQAGVTEAFEEGPPHTYKFTPRFGHPNIKLRLECVWVVELKIHRCGIIPRRQSLRNPRKYNCIRWGFLKKLWKSRV